MQKTIVVVDVPTDATPEQAEGLLNAPGDSFFLVQVLPLVGCHRAYLRRYKQAPPTKAQASKENDATVEGATALSILRANRDKSVRDIVDLLRTAGVERGRQWVCEQLDATCAEDGREEEALAFVKTHCGESYTPQDVVTELRYMTKIKRSKAWARRRLEEERAAVRSDNS